MIVHHPAGTKKPEFVNLPGFLRNPGRRAVVRGDRMLSVLPVSFCSFAGDRGTILESRETEDREYRALESITGDNYPRCLLTADPFLQKRNGIIHANLIDFIREGKRF